ncbi:hypothetical protein BT67DRAFT_443911 [Trichocladium antarcticum]|uniref:Uncharacterized protein n=1 Tax=Trichocladium antarcticum TaxID=1450529 RepID=A0AAN6UG23_9PEZI|nr:hypothetical protein BT67DRAFT_443911 [Trichocladium antarcticum]
MRIYANENQRLFSFKGPFFKDSSQRSGDIRSFCHGPSRPVTSTRRDRNKEIPLQLQYQDSAAKSESQEQRNKAYAPKGDGGRDLPSLKLICGLYCLAVCSNEGCRAPPHLPCRCVPPSLIVSHPQSGVKVPTKAKQENPVIIHFVLATHVMMTHALVSATCIPVHVPPAIPMAPCCLIAARSLVSPPRPSPPKLRCWLAFSLALSRYQLMLQRPNPVKRTPRHMKLTNGRSAPDPGLQNSRMETPEKPVVCLASCSWKTRSVLDRSAK